MNVHVEAATFVLPVTWDYVESDENARLIVDATGAILCLTSILYVDALIAAINGARPH